MPTRSMPTVSCLSMRLGDGELGADAVGARSRAAARGTSRCRGGTARRSRRARRRPPAGRCAPRATFISSTARSPASMSTPAAAYDESLTAAPRRRPGSSASTASMRSTVARPLCTTTWPEPTCSWSAPWPAIASRARPAASPSLISCPRGRACPTRSRFGIGIGYEPSKQARHSRSARLPARRRQPVERDEGQRVGADRRADLLDAHAGRDELGAAREVDAVEARPHDRRARDAHVHLGGARLAQHPHERPLGVAAHDRVVDDDEALAGDDLAQRVELEPDAELPDRLRRLDERAADVGVLDQALRVRDAALLGEADRRRRPRLGDRDDEVGVGRAPRRPACGRSAPARCSPSGRRSWCRGGRGRRTRTGSPWASRGRSARCARRPRRWRAARRARPRARASRRRCRAPPSRSRRPSRGRGGRARAAARRGGRARRTACARP